MEILEKKLAELVRRVDWLETDLHRRRRRARHSVLALIAAGLAAWMAGGVMASRQESTDAVLIDSQNAANESTARIRTTRTTTGAGVPGVAGIVVERSRLRLGTEGYLNVTSSPAAAPVEGDLRYTGGSVFFRDASTWQALSVGSPSGQFLQFTPAGAQADASANASIFLNDTGGGNLLQLQSGGLDRFVVTNAGVLTSGTWNGASIGPAYGGLGLNTSASTGIPSVSAGTWSVNPLLPVSLGGTGVGTVGAAGSVSYSNGAAYAFSSAGVAGQPLKSGGASAPTWGPVELGSATEVTGTLGVPNGGTGATTLSANGLLLGGGAGALTATAVGSSGTVLTGTGGAPAFSATPTLTSLTTTGQNGLSLNPYGAGAGQTGEKRFLELAANGTHYVGFKAPDAINPASIIWTLPDTAGAAGQVLARSGASALAWATPATGTVTSISQGAGVVLTPNPIVSTGTVAVDFGGTGSAATVSRSDHSHAPLTAGTGLSSAGAYDGSTARTFSVAYGTTATTATAGNDTRLNPAPSSAGRILYDSGAAWTALAAGTATQVLHGGAAPSWGAVSLTADVAGTLAPGNGGTGIAGVGGVANRALLTTDGASWSAGQVNLGTMVTGSLPVGNLNGGTGAGAGTFWRGDGTWAAPSAAMAMGSPVTGGTAGSVLFVGAGPALAQDNATFFWDDTNKRLGLGTTIPSSRLSVLGNIQTDAGPTWPTNGGADFLIDNNAGGARLVRLASNFYFGGTDRYARSGGASAIMLDATTAATAGDLWFRTAPSGVADAPMALTERMRLKQNGDLGIGTGNPSGRLHVEKDDNDDLAKEILTVRRSRADATAPGADFGGDLAFRLEGFTDATDVVAARMRGAWESGQTDDTTARDSYLSFATMTDNALSERMRITTPGIVIADGEIPDGIATKVEILGKSTIPVELRLHNFGDPLNPQESDSRIVFEEQVQGDNFVIRYNTWAGGVNENLLEFIGGGTTHMTIDRSGSGVGIGIPGDQPPTAELEIWKADDPLENPATAPAVIVDRRDSDGTLISFRRAGVEEGVIDVTAGFVNYANFTGSHLAWTEERIELGMLVTLTGRNRRFHEKPESEILYGVLPSTVANDSKILGPYLGLLRPAQPASPDNPHLVMAVGNGDLWVTDRGGGIDAGDYLVSSAVRGHAMKDTGEWETSHIVARAAEPVSWNDVAPDASGLKRKRISVFFESFTRRNAVAESKEVADLKGKLAAQEAELAAFKARLEAMERLVNRRIGR